ncbi:MAG: CPBP family intramembrane glutamic endopeptidase [Myxococcota bacterium]
MTAQRPPSAPPPFPDVRSAFLLTIGAILAGGLIGVLFFDLGPLAADGIGTALGIGGVATLAARRVAEPQAARIGLVPLPLRAWPMILCLVPAVLLASELDNFAYDWSPKTEVAGDAEAGAETGADAGTRAVEAEVAEVADVADPAAIAEGGADGEPASETRPTAIAEAIAKAAAAAEAETPKPLVDPNDPFSLMEAFIVVVGIGPVIHEFLFRGVLQQGLVAQLGLMRGVTLASLLWTMLRPPGLTSPARFAAAFIAWFALGWLLGMVRAATGSILGSILLASLWASIGFASLALQDRVALPGMNVDGTHLPIALTLASVLLVAWAGRRVLNEAREQVPGGDGSGRTAAGE